jgi:hypothetical protein
MTDPTQNSRGTIEQLQLSLGFTGNEVTGYLDRNTYRGIRDWKADFQRQKTQAIAQELIEYAIRPGMRAAGVESDGLETLLLGTAIHESLGFTARKQFGAGVGLSLFQIEPDTAKYYMSMLQKTNIGVYTAISQLGTGDLKADLENNDQFAASLAAVIYTDRLRRADVAMPAAGDVNAAAAVWKKFYNTTAGKGTVAKFTASWTSVMGKGN